MAQIRLRKCAVWSGPLLSACIPKAYFPLAWLIHKQSKPNQSVPVEFVLRGIFVPSAKFVKTRQTCAYKQAINFSPPRPPPPPPPKKKNQQYKCFVSEKRRSPLECASSFEIRDRQLAYSSLTDILTQLVYTGNRYCSKLVYSKLLKMVWNKHALNCWGYFLIAGGIRNWWLFHDVRYYSHGICSVFCLKRRNKR